MSEITYPGTVGQWPDSICSGFIEYAPATNYSGFSLRDVSHGIPTIGAVQAALGGD